MLHFVHLVSNFEVTTTLGSVLGPTLGSVVGDDVQELDDSSSKYS